MSVLCSIGVLPMWCTMGVFAPCGVLWVCLHHVVYYWCVYIIWCTIGVFTSCGVLWVFPPCGVVWVCLHNVVYYWCVYIMWCSMDVYASCGGSGYFAPQADVPLGPVHMCRPADELSAEAPERSHIHAGKLISVSFVLKDFFDQE